MATSYTMGSSYYSQLEPFSILAPDNTHLAPDLKIESRVGFFYIFYPKVAFGYRNGSFNL
jgi:hypothetical protein